MTARRRKRAPSPVPAVLVVGAGRFGREHLREWRALEGQGRVRLLGAVVASEASRSAVDEQLGVPAYRGLEAAPLADAAGIDVVTPAPTHRELVERCLEHAHVLVEKPIATSLAEARALGAIARRRGRVLMVGHVFRFHPVTVKLRALLAGMPGPPPLVTGRFTNPPEAETAPGDASTELLHLFDLLDHLFGARTLSVGTLRRGDLTRVSLRQAGGLNAVLDLGWHGDRRRRELTLHYADRRIACDFRSHAIEIRHRDRLEKHVVDREPGALRSELAAFLASMQGRRAPEPSAQTGARVLGVALRAVPPRRRRRPRIAVIGGGIFGIACAAESAVHGDVTLFERHRSLMTEASHLNQWRHHSGFHYPRSIDTILEVLGARDDFAARYGAAVVGDVVSYYCTAASGVEITAERYLATCKALGLSFEEALPPSGMLAEDRVSLSLRTDESVVDCERLRGIAVRDLRESGVRVRPGTRVTGLGLLADGRKRLRFRRAGGTGTGDFDYVINATYANRNLIARWLGLPRQPLRFDLIELVALEVPAPKVSITVLDGPFTSLVSTGRAGRFVLSHIHEMVRASEVTADGFPPRWGRVRSNHAAMIERATRYLPILREARFAGSIFSTRAVHAHNEDVDARPTVVTDHGFGCWSVLGGKIVTCVSNAKEIADAIGAAQRAGTG